MQNLDNPLTFPSITSLLVAILNALIVISIPIIVMFIIYAGFMYVTAQGNPEKLQVASKALMYSIIGGVVIVSSVAILAIIRSVVGEF